MVYKGRCMLLALLVILLFLVKNKMKHQKKNIERDYYILNEIHF